MALQNGPLEVGSLVRCTLVSDVVVQGAVFACDNDTGMLILMEVNRGGPSAGSPTSSSTAASPASPAPSSFANPNTHILNTKFIKAVEFINDTTGGHLMPLPRSVLGETLPAAENGDSKKLVAKLKNENKKRTGLYHELASIDACDAFEYFLKLNPDLKWSVDPSHLNKATKALAEGSAAAVSEDAEANQIKLVLALSGGSILLSGNNEMSGYSWKRPRVIPMNEHVSPDLVARITKQADACASKA